SLPSSAVTIPAGQSRANVDVAGVDLGTTTLEATAVGYTADSMAVRVTLPELRIASLNNTYAIGAQPNAFVSFSVSNDFAGPRAVSERTISLTSSVPSVFAVTSPITIAAGANSSGASACQAIAAGTSTITASAVDATPSAGFTVTVNQ
ncbi:MAG: hypothetical protein ACRCWJ_06030, partial [Casimicrobium sp.]